MVVDTAYGRLGAAICWDQWFPESARALALQGAEVSECVCVWGGGYQDEAACCLCAFSAAMKHIK